MPVIFNELSNLLGSEFITTAGVCNTSGSQAIYLPYYNNPADIQNEETPDGALFLCGTLKSLSNDIFSSVLASNIATMATVNQLIDFLRCSGPNICTLTGPSQCCPELPNSGPGQIQIPLPQPLNMPIISFTTNGQVLANGTNVSDLGFSRLF